MSLHYLRHGKIELALHELRPGRGRPLLLLHGLGERSPEAVPEELQTWTGPVHGLDFTGHGASAIPAGGGYSAEILMADADHALAALGPATVVGRGLGAYVATLLAGARPALVRGAVLCDGPGMTGGGPGAASPYVPAPTPPEKRTPDPLALFELSHDVRPPDYTLFFVRFAARSSGLAQPLAVCCLERPEWLRAAAQELGLDTLPVRDALARYAAEP